MGWHGWGQCGTKVSTLEWTLVVIATQAVRPGGRLFRQALGKNWVQWLGRGAGDGGGYCIGFLVAWWPVGV